MYGRSTAARQLGTHLNHRIHICASVNSVPSVVKFLSLTWAKKNGRSTEVLRPNSYNCVK